MYGDVVRALSVSKYFGSTKALSSISLRVKKGEFVLLLGPNGAGKSTLLKLVAGLYRPTSGRIFVLGSELHSNFGTKEAEIRKRISFAGENYALYDHITVMDNLLFFAKLYDIPDPSERINALLGDFGIEDLKHRRVEELSRGTKQKVAICRALLNDSDILLLDEPSAFLDPAASELLRAKLERLVREGKSIIYATQRIDELFNFKSNILLISRGRIKMKGSANSILSSIRNVDVEITTLNSVDAGAIKGNWTLKKSSGNSFVFQVKSVSTIPELISSIAASGGKILSVNYLKENIIEMMAD